MKKKIKIKRYLKFLASASPIQKLGPKKNIKIKSATLTYFSTLRPEYFLTLL